MSGELDQDFTVEATDLEKCRAEVIDRTKRIRRCGNYARTVDGGLCWRHR